MAGEAILTISASGQTSVEIWTTKLDHNIDKPLSIIPIPRSKSTMNSETAPTTFIIDIGRVNEVILVQGFLVDDTTESAKTKKANLLDIVYYERTVTVTWGTGNNQQTYSGNINKVMITETPGIVGLQQSGYYTEKNFAVQLSLVVGTDK